MTISPKSVVWRCVHRISPRRLATCAKDSLSKVQVLRRVSNIVRLSRIQSRACDVSGLGRISADELNTILSSRQLAEEWQETEQVFNRLEVPEFAGGVNPGDRRAIYYLVRALALSSILEIGTHIGASTLALSQAAKRLRSVSTSKQVTVTTVDICDVNDPVNRPWLEMGARYAPKEIMDRTACSAFVTFHTSNSLDFLRRESGRDTFDFVFLDGDHSAPAVYQEIPAVLARLKHPGFILLHDYFPKLKPLWSDGACRFGVRLAVQRLEREGAGIEVLPLGVLPWRTRLNSNVTSLALVVRKD